MSLGLILRLMDIQYQNNDCVNLLISAPELVGRKKMCRFSISVYYMSKSKELLSPAKSKRGRQKGDGKKFVINCRKMSQNVLRHFMTFHDVL